MSLSRVVDMGARRAILIRRLPVHCTEVLRFTINALVLDKLVISF